MRNTGEVISNNLTKGLITEATGLNFPENAVTDADNVVFERFGRVSRRLGIDIESDAETLSYADTDGLVTEYIWRAIAETGGFTFLVMQMGHVINFFKLDTTDSLSPNVMPVSLNLDDYKAAGAGSTKMLPASFTAGSGYLFIAHPCCDPIVVRWSSSDSSFQASKVVILIRDFVGVDDGLKVDENPSSLSNPHYYNLLNQSWDQKVRVGTVSNELGDGGSLTTSPLTLSLNWATLS